MSKIGKQKRDQIYQQNDVPGPGNYDPNIDNSSIIMGQPKWTMHGTKTREIVKINNIPGPGQYDPIQPASLRSTIIFSRHEQIDKETLLKPGPDQYRTDISYLSKIAFSLGGTKRETNYKRNLPGPGQYEFRVPPIIPSIKLGRQKREYKVLNNTVGPGTYDIPTTLRTDRDFYIAPKRERALSSFTPAPNAYNQTLYEKGKAYRIGTSKREPINEKSVSPGPAAYDPKLNETRGGFSIGRSKRNANQINQIPGPTAYDPIKPCFAPKFSILSRHYQRSQSVGPGPQAYSLTDFRDTKNVIFGNAKRDDLKINRLPGPGYYEINMDKPNTANSFGKQRRRLQEIKESGPGPGNYDIKSVFDLQKK